MEERHLSLSEVAELMEVAERTVRRWIKSGRLKAYKPGRDYRIPESAVKDFIERSEAYPKAPAPPPLELEKQRGGEEERHSVYLEVFKKHMARRASAWDQQADEESSRFFADWRTSAAYAGEVIGEAFVLTRTVVRELCPAIDQDFAPEDAVREQRELVDAVKNMLKVVDKVRARGAPALERAIQGGIDHAELDEARAEQERIAKERRAAFELVDGRQSA